MSISFNKTDTLNGLVQGFEKEIGADIGYISGNTNRLKEFTAGVNQAFDDYVYLALKSSGKWQFDDSNQTDYPIIYANIVSGQQDYTFLTDESGNLVLDIFKVSILNSATDTVYHELEPIDQQATGQGYDEPWVESGVTGAPTGYDKTANGIIFDVTPNYNATNGLKVAINREASYFTYTDTTKKPGVPGLHHRYFYLKPALDYARRNNLANYNLIREEVVSFEGDEEKGIIGSIERYFGRRARDERKIIKPKKILYI